MKTNDELRAGYRVHIRRDPTDPDFEWLSVRYPCNTAAGGRATPECELEGDPAYKRWIRLLLARTAGFVGSKAPGNRKIVAALMRIYEKYKD